MPGARRAPHPALAGLVDQYVGFDHVLDPRAIHRGVPSPLVTVIIAFDVPLDCAWFAEPERTRRRVWLLASGLHTDPALIRTGGRQHGIQLRLTPLGCRLLLGVPAAEIAAEFVAHDELPLGLSACQHERLASADGWDARFDLLDGYLMRLAGDAGRASLAPGLGEAWRILIASGGGVSIARLADHVGWSRRTLSSRFGGEFGLTPKRVARLARFDRARRLAAGGATLADAAFGAGYSDQAHMSREWLGFAGVAPREHLREEFPIVQDVPAAG